MPTKLSLADQIAVAAMHFRFEASAGRREHDAFTDTDLQAHIESVTGKRVERSVLARSRGLLEAEPDSPIVRYGTFRVGSRELVHFKLSPAMQQLADTAPTPGE